MALAEHITKRGLGRIFAREKIQQPEIQSLNIADAEIPARQDSEGDILTGSDVQMPETPPLTVRIVGSRNRFTGEIASYHQEIHGISYPIRLEEGNQFTIH